MERMFTFDNELKIINYFRDMCHPALGLPQNEMNLDILNSLYDPIRWKDWADNSAKDKLPPDFINANKKLMMEVMRIDDHASNKGKTNAVKSKENTMLRELKERGILDRVSRDATVKIIADSGLTTNEDHNFNRYFENFKRVVLKHANKVENYKSNYYGYKLIFFIFDESSGNYFEIPNNIQKVDVMYNMKFHGKIHLFWLDEMFVEIVKKSNADYLIWYKPYSAFETIDGMVDGLPKVVIYDLANMRVESIKYDSTRMISSEF